jgi:selenocysteine lyase/cysteine desulfurase
MSELTRRSFLKTTTAAGLASLPATRALATPSSEDPLGIRGEFPVTDRLAYLNSASVGPLSRAVRDALATYADEKMLYRDPANRRSTKANARAKFANLFGADEDEIAFLYSSSDGENIVVSALDWKEGDNIVLDELHFTTSFVLYRELEKRVGVELRIVPSRVGRAQMEDFEAMIDARTRLLSVAWVSNRNGFRYDLPSLGELAHAHEAYLYADAVQAFGTFSTNLHDEGVDFACGNGYKWLFADFGCAPMYVRREHLEWMRPDRYGHGQVAETLPNHQFRLKTSAEKFEYASNANGPIAAMDAALDLLTEVGLDRIEKHTAALAGQLYAAVAELGLDLFTPPDNRSSIVSFYHGLDSATLSNALAAENVPVTFQEEGRLLRSAVAMFNNQSDVNQLLGVLAKLV